MIQQVTDAMEYYMKSIDEISDDKEKVILVEIYFFFIYLERF